MKDPVIIDYPKNREGLKRVFKAYTNTASFKKNIKIANSALGNKSKNG